MILYMIKAVDRQLEAAANAGKVTRNLGESITFKVEGGKSKPEIISKMEKTRRIPQESVQHHVWLKTNTYKPFPRIKESEEQHSKCLIPK